MISVVNFLFESGSSRNKKYTESDAKLIPGIIDKEFFRLMYKLYRPMLSKDHLKDKYQFTIFIKNIKHPVGFITISKTPFIQLAIIPKFRGKNVAQIALRKLIKNLKVDKINWTCNKNNYPSLKLLYDFGGGIFVNTIKNKKRDSYEGFFRVNKNVSKNMRTAIESVLPETKEKYIKWLNNEFNKRSKELKELEHYLKNYSENNKIDLKKSF